MKKVLFALATTAIMIASSCTKDNKETVRPEDHTYSGKMTVTYENKDFEQDGIKIDVTFNEDARTLTLLFKQVKFVPQMPVTLDITVPSVSYTSKEDGNIIFSGENIVPLTGKIPYPNFTVTGLSGKISGNPNKMDMSLKFGNYPVKYSGVAE